MTKTFKIIGVQPGTKTNKQSKKSKKLKKKRAELAAKYNKKGV